MSIRLVAVKCAALDLKKSTLQNLDGQHRACAHASSPMMPVSFRASSHFCVSLQRVVVGLVDGEALGLVDGLALGLLGLALGEKLGLALGLLVGHSCALHVCASPPEHALPPQLGAGFVHERVNVPPPHEAGHGDPHALHAPCTVGQW